jgi:hypothetical protein
MDWTQMKLSCPGGGQALFDRVKGTLSHLWCCILQIKQQLSKNRLHKGIQHLPISNSWSNLELRPVPRQELFE